MALPKIDTPIYDLELPLSKKKIRFRPFLVKEQKNLLMAMESDEKDSIEKNIKQILSNCTLSKGFKIDNLPVIDVEYYFLNLRARSVGEVVTNKYRCDNIVEEKPCNNVMETNINLLEIELENYSKDKDVIQLTDKISVKLNYPQFSTITKLAELTSSTDVAFKMIADSIDYIYDGEQFYYAKESTEKELLEFVESLSQQQFAKIEEFFNSMPRLRKKIEMKCSRCGFEHKIDVEGLESFFG